MPLFHEGINFFDLAKREEVANRFTFVRTHNLAPAAYNLEAVALKALVFDDER